jgi:predicted Zn-dependent peptidase
VAFKASMYRSFVIGHLSDLQFITRKQAEDWFDKYYRAKNLTVVVVGDVDPATAMPILEKYLGRIPAGTKPEGPITVEPPQRAEKRLIMEDPSQPFLLIGWHRPDVTDPDDPVYDVINDILSGGRSSRLYKSLVKEKKLALFVRSEASLEGQKYPGLFGVYAVPNKGKTNAECEQAIYAELDRLKTEPVTQEELEGVKARAKMQFVDSVDSNMGIALQLAFSQNLQGDWRQMFKWLDRIDAVTPEDIMRVAGKTFVKSNRTVGLIETTPAKAD